MADEETADVLIPRVERAVSFYGDAIPVAVVGDEAYVPLRQITDYPGIKWSGQYLRVQRHEILARHVRKVAMTAADGKQYETLCVALEYLPGCLFGVTTSRVREELRDKLVRYQEECFRVLWRAFQAEVLQQALSASSALLEPAGFGTGDRQPGRAADSAGGPRRRGRPEGIDRAHTYRSSCSDRRCSGAPPEHGRAANAAARHHG